MSDVNERTCMSSFTGKTMQAFSHEHQHKDNQEYCFSSDECAATFRL